MRRRALCFGLFVILLAGCGRAPASIDEPAPLLGSGPISTPAPTDPVAAATPAPHPVRSDRVVKASPGAISPRAALKRAESPYIQTGPRGSIGGRVTDGTGTPVSGVCVMTRDVGDRITLAGAAGQYVTDRTGAYRLSGTPSRVLVLIDTTCGAGAGNHTTAFYTADGLHPVVIDVTDTGASGVDVVLQQKGRLDGTVTGVLGVPLPGVCVKVTTARKVVGSAATDLFGRFEVKLDQGTYDVEFDPCAIPSELGAYVREFYDGGSSVASATPVSVRSGTVANISAQLDRPPLVP